MSLDRTTIELLRKYDRPGPRYTSYPTAPEWSERFTRQDYLAALAEASTRRNSPISLYVHIPFCPRRCYFCGCTSVITKRRESIDRYLAAVGKELATVREALSRRNKIIQLHWGGGTPTYLDEKQIERLFRSIASLFEILPDAEVAIEVDPRTATLSQLRLLRSLGFNRLSMGVQDLSPNVQEAIGRRQTRSETEILYRNCRELGFSGLNMDLIYGLPEQNLENFSQSVSAVIALRPDRVAIYSYAHLPSLKSNQRLIDQTTLPTIEEKFGLFAHAVDAFLAAGYIQIGMDHFALPDDELALSLSDQKLHRNFMGYTVKPSADMIGIGMSAIGDLVGRYAQNESKLESYWKAIDQNGLATYRGYQLSQDDLIRRRVITFLMCNFILPYQLLWKEFSIEHEAYFQDEHRELAQFVDDGLLEILSDRLQVTPRGRTFIRNIAMLFDAYLRKAREGRKPSYSRTI